MKPYLPIIHFQQLLTHNQFYVIYHPSNSSHHHVPLDDSETNARHHNTFSNVKKIYGL